MKKAIYFGLTLVLSVFAQAAPAVNDGGTGNPVPQDGSSVFLDLWRFMLSSWPW